MTLRHLANDINTKNPRDEGLPSMTKNMRTGFRYSCHFVVQPTHLAAAAALIALITNGHRIRRALSRASLSLQSVLSSSFFQASQAVFGFRYSDKIDDQHIRLLRLPDTATDSSPAFTFHTFSLGQCPPYLAISYTWGPPEGDPSFYTAHDRRCILLNGKPFPVLPNLCDALSQLCAARPGQYLWVDSICINQASLSERSSQVAIMDSIYNGTVETMIWLGPASDKTPRAMEVARQLAAGAESKILELARDQSYGDVFIVDDPEVLKRNGLPPLTADDWIDLGDIYTRAWFGRVWMLQEVALSCNPTVLIGHYEAPWDVIADAAALTGMSRATLGLVVLGNGRGGIPLVQGLLHAINLQIVRQWSQGEVSRFREVLQSVDFSFGIDTSHPWRILLQLLLGSNGSKATFRRDRVYALLGLVNHMARLEGQPRLNLKVDYHSTDDQVLTNLGFAFFQETQSLHLLSLAGLASRGTSSSLPTWIPSFETVHAPILNPNYSSLRPFDACAGQDVEFTIDQDRHHLHVKTIRPHLGSIEELGETWSEMLHGSLNKSMQILLHCGTTYLPTQQPIVEAFWRTLIMDNDLVQRPAPPNLVEAFGAWMTIITIAALIAHRPSNPTSFNHFDSLEPLWTLANSRDSTNSLPKTKDMIALAFELGMPRNPDVPVISESECRARFEAWNKAAAPFEALLRLTLVPNRRIARTIRGYLCLVPTEAQVGDKVMIVAGCPTPLVLRRFNDVDDCFSLVGDAYAHGAMFGEHVTGDFWWTDISLV
ncbi:HET domain-containing protein [Fusarium sp. Ph1]|nr:HET domain-containing protein [Fusarium sp. Ph1]